jgi:hypothetical protein
MPRPGLRLRGGCWGGGGELTSGVDGVAVRSNHHASGESVVLEHNLCDGEEEDKVVVVVVEG